MTRKTNRGKKFPTSRVNALKSGAYACDVHSARFYVSKLTTALNRLEDVAVNDSNSLRKEALPEPQSRSGRGL